MVDRENAPFFAIVNPAAAGGSCGTRFSSVVKRLAAFGKVVDARLTRAPGHATELAKEAFALGHRKFLSVGGDGTAFEVVNGIFDNPSRSSDNAELGILPLGTGNSFLRDFGIVNEEQAIRAVAYGRSCPFDVIQIQHQDGVLYYINLLSVGFSAEVGALTNRRFKNLGTAGYVVAVAAKLLGLKAQVHAFSTNRVPTLDQRPASLISFSNSRYTGGTMMMAPPASVNDGELDIIHVGITRRWELAKVFPRIFKGTHIEHTKVEARRAKRIDFANEPLQDVMIDGEVLRLSIKSLEVLPNALRVFT